MPTANLVNENVSVITENDSIVIVENLETLRGGRTLVTSGDTINDVLKAGHVIIKETATGHYKPMPLTSGGDEYDALPGGHTYEGVLVASILKTRPFAAIMVRGTVNQVAAPYSMTSILAAFKTAVPLIRWTQD